MKSKTEELLYLILWTCETISRPTFHNLTESFEGWVYRTGVHRQLLALEKARFLESQRDSAGDRIHRLTAEGRTLALGGRDPMVRWKRRWDRRWRMVIFDVPQTDATVRVRLRRSLADRGFGYLQNSVWITPDPLIGERKILDSERVNVESLIMLEARPCAGETDAEIVRGAWDFNAINQRYDVHAQVLSSMPKQPLTDAATARALQAWLREERLAWKEAMDADPLLPKCLHPPGYRGMSAWKLRVQVMAEVGSQMRSFHIPPLSSATK